MIVRSAAIIGTALIVSGVVYAADWRGSVSSEFTFFPESSVGTDNWKTSGSLAADVEFFHQISDEVSFTARPFLRIDQRDDERTHADLRELVLSTSGDTWEFNGGLSTVFWGVTESRHLVDVINQTDNVENLDGEDKLGQPMLNFKWFSDFGEFEAYLLPLFRERTFAGSEGRPFSGITVDTDSVQYESSKRRRSLDTALRWSHSFDYWDLGLHYFNGTSRDPLLVLQQRAAGPVLIPRYLQMQQLGIDAQGLYGDVSVKAEIVYRSGDEIEDHPEVVTGFEYTLVGVFSPFQDKEWISSDWCSQETANFVKSFICNDRLDLGIVVEYLWDERGDKATHPFQNDLLAGFRFAFNDERSSDALLGVIQDLNGGATSLSLEASTRLFESYRLTLEMRKFSATRDDPRLNALSNENFVRLDFSYFF